MITTPHQINSSDGYIALISAIIISLVLLVMTAAVSQAAFFARFNALDAEYKRISLGLAESCVNVALLRISADYNYNGPETVLVATDAQGVEQKCDIKSVVYGLEVDGKKPATISTTGYYHGTFSNMQVTATVHNPAAPETLRASLTVVVHVINDNGGSKHAGDFAITVTGNNVSPASFGGTENGTYVYMAAGTYTTSAVGDSANYTQISSDDCNGAMSQSEVDSQANKICNIVYDDKATTATLGVTVNVTNGYGGTLTPSQVSLKLDGAATASGTVTSGIAAPSSHTFSVTAPTGYTASAWGEDCSSSGIVNLNGGDNKNCAVNIVQNAPPSPGCADTVMMLSGGMSSVDLSHEGVAAQALLDLYATVTPHPLAGVGSYGGVDGSAAQVPIGGQLNTNYGSKTANTGLYGTINQIVTTINSSGGTDLSAAITSAKNELNSVRHISGNKKVMIIVSDGKPNRPSGNVDQAKLALIAADSAKLSPSNIEIFTVHFGTSSGRDLVAKLANGTVAYPPHQPGSKNDVTSPNSQAQIDSENADGDHFFISPDSAAMKNIFETIAKLVCSAINNPPPPPSTTGKIVVVTHIINDNGGVKTAADFTMTISAGNPSINNFPGADSPGVTVTVNPGNYSVNESGDIGSYTKSLGSSCSGSITAGQTVTCTIINDDLPPAPPPPPPPPPPPADIDIDDWQEVP